MAFRPKKSLGQHFLRDPNMIQKIVDSFSVPSADRVIEIGPGTGALTRVLAPKYEDFHAIEVDQRAIEHLNNEIPKARIHNLDIREDEWKKLLKVDRPVHVIGNIPYNLTSPILFSLLETREQLEDAMLMVQKEVGERLVADIRTKAYGILSVQVQLMSSVEKLFTVPPEVFSPPPRVESLMIRLTFDKAPLKCTDQHLKTVVRTAFNQRRKKIKNALEPVMGSYKPDNFDIHRRPEAVPPEEYEMLTVQLQRNGILT